MNRPPSRRRFLEQAGSGAGWLALLSMLAESQSGSPALAGEQPPHFAPRAKRVIWLFMHGGPSHVDLFDPKPDLARLSGDTIPQSFGQVMTRRDVANNPLLGPLRAFRPRGDSGLEVSDFLPQIGGCADELCVVRSMHGDSVNHPQSVYQMNTGSVLMGRPSVGSWVSYGLGSENNDLPSFVVLPDPSGGLKGGPPAWGNGYLPARFQGVTMRPQGAPILNLAPAEPQSPTRQRQSLDLLGKWNARHRQQRDQDDQLEARIASYELAYRMQTAAPDLVSMDDETADTERLYGIDQAGTAEFGRRCLLARRMVERGVRFVQVVSGDTNGWDAHNDVVKNHTSLCQRTDKPVAGLLKDLRRRGLLDDTLVIWGGEFGRMPMSEKGKGRDHNPWGYSLWMAGAGVNRGTAYGATDAIGLRASENPVHVNDFHATVLHILGLNHLDLTYEHHGLDERLTGPGDEARVVHELLA
jgi:hypothetical protein